MVMSLAATLVIRDAVPRDFLPVTKMLSDASADTPVACWLDPDEQRRPLTVLTYVGGLVRKTIADGIARVAEDRGEIVGAALWSLHSDTGWPVNAKPVVDDFDGALTVVHQRQRRLERLMDERRPWGEPCQHLVCLGVRPDRQRQGIGSYLLLSHYAFLHVTGTPAYVVAPDDRLANWFQRHRYSGVGPPDLLPGGPSMQAMWRRPGLADLS